MCGKTVEQLTPGTVVAYKWDGLLEANPRAAKEEVARAKAARLAEMKEARIKAEEAKAEKEAAAAKAKAEDSDDQSWGYDWLGASNECKGAGASGAAHNVSSHVPTPPPTPPPPHLLGPVQPSDPPPNKLLPIGRSIKRPIGRSIKRQPLLNPSEVMVKRSKSFSSSFE